MLRYIVQRLLLLPVLILIFSFIVFGLVQAPPGDFLTSYIATLASSGSSMDQAQVDALKEQFGVDQPFTVQYRRWMDGLLHGDLGRSLEYQRPNAELIGERLVLTMLLALFAFVITWAIAIPAGIYSATHPNSVLDYVLTVFNYVGVATPNFMLALILMWFAFDSFGISITGLFSPEFVQAPWSWARFVDLLKHIWVPAIVLGVAGTARLTRIMRANLLDELNKQYVITARAKGLSEWRLVMKYPVRLAFNPLISTIGWYLPQLFSGSLIVATVMNLPNIGPLLLRALQQQDMYLAGSILLIYCLLTDHRHPDFGRAAGDRRSPHPHGGRQLTWPKLSQAASTAELMPKSKAEDRVSVASNWKLVWWRFRKNRLAVASVLVLVVFYTIVLVPDFFATQDPEATEAKLAFIPPQRICLHYGRAAAAVRAGRGGQA